MSSSINTGTDIRGLTPNTSYTFSIYPINGNGQETTATTTTFTTLPYLTTQYVSSVDSYSEITVGWTKTGEYSSVYVYYSTDGSTYTSAGSTSSSSMKVAFLSANTQYYFKLVPYNSSGTAGTTQYISGTSATTLGYIASLIASTGTPSTVTLSYSGIYSSARIYYGTTSGLTTNYVDITTSSTSTGTTNSLDIGSLTSNSTYYFTMYPYNSNNVVGTSYVVSAIPVTYLDTTKLKFAFSVRLLISTYTEAVIQIRRSSDSTTQDFYTDSTQSYLTTGSGGTGTSYSSWIGSSTGYITKWYDQSGQGNHATNSTAGSTQPLLYYNSTTGKYITSWNTTNSTKLTLTSSSQPNTVFSHFYPSNSYYGTLIGTSIDYSVRFKDSTTASIYGDSNADDWFSYGGGTKVYCVNNSTSTSTFKVGTTDTSWVALSLSVGTPTWRSVSFSTIGYTMKEPTSRSFSGYIVDLICHNTTMDATNMQAFYSNRLFTNTTL